MELEVGDVVKVVADEISELCLIDSPYVGQIGKVVEITYPGAIPLVTFNTVKGTYSFGPEELVLVKTAKQGLVKR